MSAYSGYKVLKRYKTYPHKLLDLALLHALLKSALLGGG
jgi:hypothetical protein